MNDDGAVVYDAAATAEAFATALLSMREWVHRRVETIAFEDADTVRRTTSVDFTVMSFLPSVSTAAGATLTLVPLAYLAKRPVTSLDVRDAAAAAVPVLTTEQNGVLTAAALSSLAVALVADRGGMPDADVSDIRDVLRTVSLAPAAEATAALTTLRSVLDDHAARHGPLAVLAASPEFTEVVATLAENFVLVAVVEASVSERHVLKFSYVERAQGEFDERGWRERLLDGLGLTPMTLVVEVPAANLASSFHVEVRTPEGVGITEAVLYGATRDRVVASPSVREGQRTVHLLAPRDPGPACQVKVNLRAAPGGWLRSTFFAIAAVAHGHRRPS